MIPYDIIAKYYANHLSAKENEELQKWISENSENQKVFSEYKEIWELSKSDKIPNFDTEKALLQVNSKLKAKHQPRIGLKQILMIAASLVIMFGVYYFGFQSNNSNFKAYAEIENDTDSAMFVELPDKSKVWLKSGSKIEYEQKFNDSLRKVILDGTAYFEVEHNENKAFVVECEKIEIKVLGTKFNVEMNDNSVQTHLFQGKIKFYESKSVKNTVTLNPNEAATFNKKNFKIEVDKFTNNNSLAWKTGILEYDNINFTQVIKELEKYYDKEIILKNSDFKDYAFSGKFENKSLEQVLYILEISMQLQVVEKNGKIILR